MDIRLKWYYRLGFLLLLMIVLFIFIKLQPIWFPVIKVIIHILLPFAIAGFITYLLHPIVEKLHESGLQRGLAVFIIYLLFFGGIGFAIYRGLPEMIKQLKDLAHNVPELTNHYMEFTRYIQKETAAWPDGIQERIQAGILSVEKGLEGILSNVLASIVDILSSFFTILLIPFISFYMLKDYGLLKKTVWYLTPRKWRQGGARILRDIDHSLGSYIRGQILICAVIGTISAVLFWFFDMKYPLLLGFIIGITNVIPYFGPVIGAVPALIIAATISMKMIIIMIVIILLLQFLEGNILSPFIVGKSLRIHPLVIMLALFAGEQIGGILGLILSVPIVVIIKVGILHTRKYFEKKHKTETFAAVKEE
jgi:predicted PurR-regulated permease PerM